MFYSQPNWNQDAGEPPVRALVSLVPSESKRVIAKGVAALPEVKRALDHGIVIIARGTTTAFVAEELTGDKIEPKSLFASGFITDGELCATPRDMLMDVVVLRHGKRVSIPPADALREFGDEDVSIKGANAIDAEGNAGILVAAGDSGTIGGILPRMLARGCRYLIVPVGLEKLIIPLVAHAARATGVLHFKYSTGLPAALVPVPSALVVTEVQAFQVLTGVKAIPVAAGGIAGSEGTVVLSLGGDESQIEQALSLIKSVKGEPAVGRPRGRINLPAAQFNYDAQAQREILPPSDRS